MAKEKKEQEKSSCSVRKKGECEKPNDKCGRAGFKEYIISQSILKTMWKICMSEWKWPKAENDSYCWTYEVFCIERQRVLLNCGRWIIIRK